MKLAALLLFVLTASSCKKNQAAPPVEPARGRLLGIAHMALFVSDLEKARGFYRDLLGFEEAFTLPKEDGSVRISFIKVNDEQYIELFAEPPREDGRVYHISFYTDDVEALRARLVSKGLEASKIGVGKIKNRQFGIHDPDRHAVELVQYQPDGWSMRDKGKFMPESRVSTRIAHLGVLVGALEPSLKFYRDTLGFQETWRGGPSDKVLSWVNMRVPDGEDYLELMLYDTLPPPDQRGGKNHICLVVPDIHKAVAKLEARPARKNYARPIEIKVGINRKRQANLFDPDGTRVELMEPTTIDGKPTPPSKAPPPR
jgi:lactoylglutathione lyase